MIRQVMLASVSMKEAYRAAIFASSLPGVRTSGPCSPIPTMMSRTASSARLRSSMNDPVSGWSSGISARASQPPLTWR